jgi:hypothetical protein
MLQYRRRMIMMMVMDMDTDTVITVTTTVKMVDTLIHNSTRALTT